MITCSVLNSVKIPERNPKFQLTNMSHGNANINPLLDALTKTLDTLLLMLQGIYNLFYHNYFTHFISQRVRAFSILTIDNIYLYKANIAQLLIV